MTDEFVPGEKCVMCASGDHYECPHRTPERGPHRPLAVAIFGDDVTVCCCDDWGYAVPEHMADKGAPDA
jgi:hypothetical protein